MIKIEKETNKYGNRERIVIRIILKRIDKKSICREYLVSFQPIFQRLHSEAVAIGTEETSSEKKSDQKVNSMEN